MKVIKQNGEKKQDHGNVKDQKRLKKDKDKNIRYREKE